MSSKARQKELLEQYEDSLLRLLMQDVAEHEGQRFIVESKEVRESGEFAGSDAELARFTRRLDAALKEHQAQSRPRQTWRWFRAAAVAVFVTVAVFLVAMTSVQAFRVRVINLWLDIRPEYTAFHLRGSNNSTQGGSMLINWSGAYVPTYIPEGYEVSSFSYSTGRKVIVFQHTQRESYIIYRELDEASAPVVDTEDADRFETIRINGYEGTLIEKNNMVTIIWEMETRLFMLQAQADAAVAVRIAEGVKYIR